MDSVITAYDNLKRANGKYKCVLRRQSENETKNIVEQTVVLMRVSWQGFALCANVLDGWAAFHRMRRHV